MNRTVAALAVLIALLAGSCTNGQPVSRTSSPAPTPPALPSGTPSPVVFRADIPATAKRVTGGCASTQAYRGPVPGWLDHATIHNSPVGLPYVVTASASAAGFIFSYPLRAHRENKILWVVRTPREGDPLKLEIHPHGTPAPLVRLSRAADSGPGEIYPSAVEVPTAGCWHFSLSWATGRGEVDLRFVSK